MKAHRFWVLPVLLVIGLTSCTSLLGNDFEVVEAVVVNCSETPNVCENDHGSTACVAGTCTPVCATGFDSCDANPVNGCETDLTSTSEHCGKCRQACTASHAQGVCRSSACSIVGCDVGWEDCNQTAADGCEANIVGDLTHCGACGIQCENAHGSTACVDSQCVPTCRPGFANCDANPANGCEADLNNSGTHCGRCNNAILPDQVCSNGAPVQARLCPAANRDCNKDLASDGCEVNVQSDRLHCGACDVSCKTGEFCSDATCKSCVFLQEDFIVQAPGWQTEGPWQVGSAKAGGGGPCTKPALQCGSPDPALDQSPTADNGLAGVALGANYATAATGPFYLTSPEFDLRASGTVNLVFWRWLNSDAAPFIVNSVEAFNGTAWQVVWASPTGTTMPFLATEWTRVEYDLTPFKNTDDAKNAGFRVRFGFAVGRPEAFHYAGWNIDDIRVERSACGL